MVDYHILEQFVTFYQTGTLRETAEKMHISQPTLTRNMQRLETEFDVPLFHRTKNSISLNETGTLAAEDAKMLLKQTENMIRHARDFDRKNRTITLGSCTPVLIPELIRRITGAFPMAPVENTSSLTFSSAITFPFTGDSTVPAFPAAEAEADDEAVSFFAGASSL